MNKDEVLDRFTKLEIKVAEQDKCISDLNSVILQQTKELKQLQKQIGKLETNIEKLHESNIPHERPPHY